MRIATLLFVLIACGTTAGCAERGIKPFGPSHVLDPARTKPCSGNQCTLQVEVIVAPSGTCSPDAFDLDMRSGSGEREIVWDLAEGFEFSTDPIRYGVQFKLIEQSDDFADPKVTNGGRRLTLKLRPRHDKPHDEYPYRINIQRSSGNKSRCEAPDPWLMD